MNTLVFRVEQSEPCLPGTSLLQLKKTCTLMPQEEMHYGVRGMRPIMTEVHPKEGGEGEVGASRKQLVHECTELLLRYLAGGTRGRGKGPVEFFDVWG